MLYPVFVLMCLITYFVCGIPFGKIFASFSGIDITQYGSKNIGMTNVSRVCGIYQGLLTLIADILKAFLSLRLSVFCLSLCTMELLPHATFGWMCAWLYLIAIIGHVFSPYLQFKGGKGIAVGFGGALALFPLVACGLFVVWLFVALCSRFISLASITAALSLPWLVFCIYWPPTFFFILPFFVASILVLWSHRTNLIRLKRGEESKFKPAKKGHVHETN